MPVTAPGAVTAAVAVAAVPPPVMLTEVVWRVATPGSVMAMPVSAPFAPTEAVAVAPAPSPVISTATSGSVNGLFAQFWYGPK